MANARFIGTGLIGSNVSGPDTPTAERPLPFAPGTTAIGVDNSEWVYGLCSEAVSGTCTFDASTFALTDIAGQHTAPAAGAAGDGMWVYLTAGFST